VAGLAGGNLYVTLKRSRGVGFSGEQEGGFLEAGDEADGDIGSGDGVLADAEPNPQVEGEYGAEGGLHDFFHHQFQGVHVPFLLKVFEDGLIQGAVAENLLLGQFALGRGGIVLAVLDIADDGLVLLVHPGLDHGIRDETGGEQVLIGGAIAIEDFPAHIDEGFDLGVGQAFVLGLDMEDPVAMADIRVVAGDHSWVPIFRSDDSIDINGG